MLYFIVFGRVDHDPAETLVRACDPDSTPESGDSVALLSVPETWSAELIDLVAAGVFAGWDWCPDTYREEANLLPINLRETFVAPWVTRYNIESDGSVVVS